MKKKILIISLIYLASANLAAQTSPSHMAVIFKKSSAYCNPCGTWGWDLQSQVESNNNQQAVIFQVQISASSDLYNSAGKELMDAFNDCTYYPAWFVNGKNKTVVSGSAVYPELTKEVIRKSADSIRTAPPLAGCTFTAQSANGILTVNTTTRFLADTSGTFQVSILLIDKNVTSYQLGIGNEANHINVLRGTMGGSAFGQLVSSGVVSKNSTFTNTFTETVTSGQDLGKQSLAVVLWKKNGTSYNFVNAIKGDLTLTSVEDLKAVHSPFVVYPNPASEVICIEHSGAEGNDAQATLTDIRGNILAIKSLEEPKTRLDLNGFAKGIYFLRLMVNGKQEVRKIRID